MFLAFTYLFIGLIVVGIPVVSFLVMYKPKQVTYLSPEAFDYKMRELEGRRLDALSVMVTQEQIDELNELYDTQEASYRIKRR